MEFLTLNSGLSIPQLGLGTADIGSFERTKQVITSALEMGYRRFDTASMYGNEEALGDAIRSSSLQRSDVVVTTKLWDGGRFNYQNTIEQIKQSNERLDLEYIDIYLQHWPVEDLRLEAWQAMEYMIEVGVIGSIGVSNFTISHLEELLSVSEIKPVVNQVEFNPFLFQEDLLNFCEDNEIVLEAYSPFSKGKKLDDPRLGVIAQQYDKTSAQLILRWGIQHGISVIPKASDLVHLQENLDIFDFEITDKDMEKLDHLNENFRVEWDPTSVR